MVSIEEAVQFNLALDSDYSSVCLRACRLKGPYGRSLTLFWGFQESIPSTAPSKSPLKAKNSSLEEVDLARMDRKDDSARGSQSS